MKREGMDEGEQRAGDGQSRVAGDAPRSAAILFILTGSIACYKACDAISQLVQRGHRVRAVATTAALKFVGPATLEGLTREKVAVELFEPGAALDHINLARWADLVMVCPATANTLNRLAAGLADDLAGALLLAHEWTKPLLLAPAMNPVMWAHPATRAAVERLGRWGARFVYPGIGATACGEVGEGRMAEADEVVAAIEAALAPPGPRLRVLVTSGGTAEPIDAVRVITNTSTGGTGALIADHFAARGHDVLLLRARHALRARGRCRERTFGSFAELDAALAECLAAEDFDVIVHAAAVSDFSVEAIEVDGVVHHPAASKLASEAAPTIRLRRNPKLVESLRARSRRRGVCVIAFKLTQGASAPEARAAVDRLFGGEAVDFVVHNDLASRAAGGAFPADIWGREGEVVQRCADRAALARALEEVAVGCAARRDRPASTRP